ncbi:hypothetical protein [Salininema proteolyticum]|uniref:Uncharacterized protein n=1 Tax=Salininema proteolyticum TaxID=1607685 RepID=A0ABV8U1K6_9ACTN
MGLLFLFDLLFAEVLPYVLAAVVIALGAIWALGFRKGERPTSRRWFARASAASALIGIAVYDYGFTKLSVFYFERSDVCAAQNLDGSGPYLRVNETGEQTLMPLSNTLCRSYSGPADLVPAFVNPLWMIALALSAVCAIMAFSLPRRRRAVRRLCGIPPPPFPSWPPRWRAARALRNWS